MQIKLRKSKLIKNCFCILPCCFCGSGESGGGDGGG
jgi:hypothetical protein